MLEVVNHRAIQTHPPSENLNHWNLPSSVGGTEPRQSAGAADEQRTIARQLGDLSEPQAGRVDRVQIIPALPEPRGQHHTRLGQAGDDGARHLTRPGRSHERLSTERGTLEEHDWPAALEVVVSSERTNPFNLPGVRRMTGVTGTVIGWGYPRKIEARTVPSKLCRLFGCIWVRKISVNSPPSVPLARQSLEGEPR